MARIAVVAQTEESARRLVEPLARLGFAAAAVSMLDLPAALVEASPDAALVEFSAAARAALDEVLADKDLTERLPVIAVMGPEELGAYESGTPADDFLMWPALPEELGARLRMVIRRRRGVEPEHILRFGDLMIDLANYRVTIAGRHVELTFKEYELLRFLASNRDRVFSREALLNRVWGYDYYGGARTVDVHIRRLRAKIEDGHHTFIETIRNVGYRFSEGP